MKGFFPSLLYLIGLAAAWEIAVAIVGPDKLPSLVTLVRDAFLSLSFNRVLASRRELPPGIVPHILATFARSSIVLLIGMVVGIGMTVLGKLDHRVHFVVRSLVDFSRAIPPLLFVPILVIFLGTGEMSLLTSAAVYAVAAIATFSEAALRTMNPAFVDQSRVIGSTAYRRALYLLVPYAFFSIKSGIQVTIPITVGIILVVEYFIGGLGLGRVLTVGLYASSTSLIFIAVFWSAIVVVALTGIYGVLSRLR